MYKTGFWNLLKSYIKDHKKIIIFFIAALLIFTMIIWLYSLPLAAVGYASVLCFAVALLFFIYDFYFYRKKNIELIKMFDTVSETIDGLPENRTFTDGNYMELLRLSHDSRLYEKNQMNSKFEQMIDYYTIWAHQIKTPIAAEIKLIKTDSANMDNTLGGAYFELYAAVSTGAENHPIITGATNTDGMFLLGSLTAGDYFLKEITAPDGYILLDGAIPFTIKADGTITTDSVYAAINHPGEITVTNDIIPSPPTPEPIDIHVNGKKIISAIMGDAPSDERFVFTITQVADENGTPLAENGFTQTKNITGSGNFSFNITGLTAGTYWYKVIENTGENENWQYSTDVYIVKVFVEETTPGNLTPTVSIEK